MERVRRKLTDNPYCHLCGEDVGDLDHLFRFCIRTKPLWQKLNGGGVRTGDQDLPFKEWFSWNIKANIVGEGES